MRLRTRAACYGQTTPPGIFPLSLSLGFLSLSLPLSQPLSNAEQLKNHINTNNKIDNFARGARTSTYDIKDILVSMPLTRTHVCLCMYVSMCVCAMST